MTTLNKLLKTIKLTKTLIGKSDFTSGNAYRITLTHNGKKCSFIFNDNFKNESTLKDYIYCLILDADAYKGSRDLTDFFNNYGYENPLEAIKAYNACKKQNERLERLFNEEEQQALEEFSYNY